MLHKLPLFALFFMAGSLLAQGPVIECRFAALDDDGHIELDEVVDYQLDPAFNRIGEFDPYTFEIYVNQTAYLTVEIHLGDDLLNKIRVPVENVVYLPVGASIFGANTINHDAVEEFVALRYECWKVL